MKMFNIQKLAIFTATLALVSSLFLVGLKATFPISYPEFISGHVTWTAATKFQDLFVMPLMLIGGFILFLILTSLFRRLNKENPHEGCKVGYHIVLWSLPAFSTISGLISNSEFSKSFLAVSLFGIFTIIVFSWFNGKKQSSFNVERVSVGILMVMFSSLYPLSISVVINIAPFSLTGGGISGSVIRNLIVVTFLAVFMIFYLFIFLKNDLYSEVFKKFVFAAQLALPLLFFTLYPARLHEVSGEVTSYNTSIYFKAFLISLVLIAIFDIIYRYVKYKKNDFDFKMLSPIALTAVIVALKFGNTNVPNVSPDDYHFGENLLGWWTYLQGYIPYIDFMPAHGLINNDFAGLLNVIFYDGTAAGMAEAGRLAFSLLTIVSFISVFAFTKSLLMTSLLVYFIGGRIIWLFLIPFAALWFNKDLLINKVKWSNVWFLTAPIVVLGVPPQGLLLVAASSVIPLYYFWETIRNKDWKSLKPVAFGFFIVFVIHILTPLGSMFVSAIKYVLVNGPINQVAYGIPWSMSLNGGGFLYEVVRMSWMVVPAAMLFTLYFLYQRNRFEPNLVLPLIATFIFSILLIPYSMGRIDPGSLSRPGSVSTLLITGFMSLVLWNAFQRDSRIWLIMGVVLLASLLRYVPLSFSPLLSSASGLINVGELRHTKETRLSNIGKAKVQDQHWARLNKLRGVIDKKLDSGESYLDLTSRNAQYFYLNRMPVIPVTAPYNMASSEQQMNAIEILEKNLPRLALLEGDNIIHDGGGLALRNHHIYQFVVDRYQPFKIDGFVIGLSKEALSRGDWGDVPVPNNDQRMALFEQAFSRSRMDFKKLPVSWGRSVDSLKSEMSKVIGSDSIELIASHHVKVNNPNNFEVTGPDPFIKFGLSKLNISGKDAGLLKFQFTCVSNRQEPKMQIFWWGDDQEGASEERSLFFTAENGTLLIPLDSVPRWYLLNEVKGIRIDLHNSNTCQSFSIRNLSFYRRS